MGLLVNIDNGGSFTDAFATDGQRVASVKSPTTPHDLSQCFVETLTRLSQELYGSENLAQLLGDTDHLRYSTTSGTNAVVEHKGSPVGVIVALGEEQSLYGAADTLGQSGLWQAMVPSAPVGLDTNNDEVDEAALMDCFTTLISHGVSRVVVALPSPVNEALVKDVVLERYPRHLLGAIPVLFSHELVRDVNHGRRLLSAVVNSYLHPGMEHFLYGAERVTKQNHLASPMLIYRNDGDSARVAKTTAIKTYGSGPRGGMEGAAAYAGFYGSDNMIAMDIGGTTTDISTVIDGAPAELAHGKIGDEEIPSSLAMGDIVSIGYGGSSMVRVKNGEIIIGPESVGSAPGPACFGRGGNVATITDALLLAGIIDPDNYLGGEIKLDKALAESVIQQEIAEALGASVEAAIDQMIGAYERQIANHMKDIVESRGLDAGNSDMLAFGGGGPMNANGIADAAGFNRLIIPAYASVFSAYGIGFSDLSHHYSVPAGEVEIRGEEAVIAEMRLRAGRDMYGEGIEEGSWNEQVVVSGATDGRVNSREYQSGVIGNIGNGMDDVALELKATHSLQHLSLSSVENVGTKNATVIGEASVNLGEQQMILPVYSLKAAQAGEAGVGPALFRDDYLTCLIHSGWSFEVSSNGDLIVEKQP
jgi:N-methylhydantoinase A/oxoprolinase/acetone carboxylase beta subunit